MTTAARRTLILVLALAGFAAATTSTYVHYRLLTVPDFTSFCDVNSTVSCAQAYLSPYGELGGIPVAIFGALYFAAVLAIAGLGWSTTDRAPQAAPSYIGLLSVPAVLFIAYLAYAAFVILNAFCILCAISYVAVLGIAMVAWTTPHVPLGALSSRMSRDVSAAVRNPAALLIVIILVAGTVFAAARFPNGNTAPVAAATVETLPFVPDDERAKLTAWWELQPKENLPIDGGGAKVVVVKFNDYQCPLCGTTYLAYKPLFKLHAGAVKLITKHYPLESECNPGVNAGHFAACEAAAAVIMARAKGKVEQMEDWLFTHQGPPILTPEQVKDAARDVAGIADFDAQYLDALKEVREDAALGSQLKVNSTPTFFINGRRLPQALAAQHLNVILEAELKRP
jgi:uncharacterized membrane protein/protein-disulfide isomerase